MFKFKPFLLKYLLSEELTTHLVSHGLLDVKFEATSHVENPDKFFDQIATTDREQYALFAEEVVRVELKVTNNSIVVLYLFFRNGREDRSDLGNNKYTFARPSSYEIGYVDNNGSYVAFHKKHYTDWYPNKELEVATENENKLLTKSIEYDIINAVINYLAGYCHTDIPLKPVDNAGKAVWTPPTTQKVQKTQMTNINTAIEQISKTIQNDGSTIKAKE